jgi:integral membrane cytochrome biogenesis protein
MTPLIPLGIALSSVVALIREHASVITHVVAVLVICAGFITIAALDFPKVRLRSPRPVPTRPSAGGGLALSTPTAAGQLSAHAASTPQISLSPAAAPSGEKSTPIAVYLLGITYGIAGVGCAGPILGAVLATSALGGSPVTGAISMVFYSAGMAFPLLLLALVWRKTAGRVQAIVRPKPLRFLGRETTWTNVISGVVLIALGLLLLLVDLGNPLGGLISLGTLSGWEETIIATFGAIPWWVLAAAGALIVAAIFMLIPRADSSDQRGTSSDKE